MKTICFISLMALRSFGTDVNVAVNVGNILFIKEDTGKTYVYTENHRISVRETFPEILKRIKNQCSPTSKWR